MPMCAGTPLKVGPQSLSSTEWTDAVTGMLPYLSADDIRRALSIFDRAMGNLQQARDVKTLLGACAGGSTDGAQNPLEKILSNLHKERHMLLQELQQLPSKRLAATCNRHGLQTQGAQTTSASQVGQELMANMVESRLRDCTLSRSTSQCPGSVPSVPHLAGHSDARRRPTFLRNEAAPSATTTPKLAQSAQPPHQPRLFPKPVSGLVGAQKFDDGYEVQDAMHRTKSECHRQRLSTTLQILSNEDPDHLFIVRRINKLGFNAGRILKAHFAPYGRVVRVLLAHSTVRHRNEPQCQARHRPGSLGFVHMDSAAAVHKIIALGAEQMVKDVIIRVQRFDVQRHALLEDGVEVNEEKPEWSTKSGQRWNRQNSESESTASQLGTSPSEYSGDSQ